MNGQKNWAYGVNINGVGTVFYGRTYFNREGIVNPLTAAPYTKPCGSPDAGSGRRVHNRGREGSRTAGRTVKPDSRTAPAEPSCRGCLPEKEKKPLMKRSCCSRRKLSRRTR